MKKKILLFSLALSLSLVSCNEEIPGFLTFYPDGGKLYYHSEGDDSLKELTQSDYSSSNEDSVTFQGIATRKLPDAVRYLTARKDGFTFLGWKQRKADGTLSNTTEDFSGTASWNYTKAEYQAYYEKNLKLSFIPLISVEKKQEDGSVKNEWVQFTDIAPLEIETYNTYSFTAKDIADFLSGFNQKKDSYAASSSSSFDYKDYGSFNKIIANIGDTVGVKEIKASENHLTYYVPYEENPSITYTYPEGAYDKEGGTEIQNLIEKKYTTNDIVSLDHKELQPSVLEPYLPDSKFLGWYSEDGDGKESKINFTAEEKVQSLSFSKAYAKFLRKIGVSFDLSDGNGGSEWENYDSPNDLKIYPGETLDLSKLPKPTNKDRYKEFDFWYLDQDGNGVFNGEIDIKFVDGIGLIPKETEKITIKPWAKQMPVLVLNLNESKNFWNSSKLQNLGFELTDPQTFVFKKGIEEGSSLADVFKSIAGCVIDPQRFVLNSSSPFLLSVGGKVPSKMDDKGFTIVPNAAKKEKVTLHYVSFIAADGKGTYDAGVSLYLNVDFSSSLRNYEASEQGVTYPDFHADENVGFVPNKEITGYFQWGWADNPDGLNPFNDFKVEENKSLDLYSIMKKKIKLTLNFQGVTKEMYGLEGDLIQMIKLKNLFSSNSTLLIMDETNQPVRAFPDSDKAYNVFATSNN